MARRTVVSRRNAIPELRVLAELGVLYGLLLALSGCIVIVTPTPLVPPTATALGVATLPPIRTRISTPTLIAINTRTPSPTASTTATPTATPTPSLTPSATPTYDVFATNTPFPLNIGFFTAAPAEIEPGGAVTLTWEVVAEQVVIYQVDALGRLSLPAFTVAPTGTLTLTTSASLRNHISFVLFAFAAEASMQAGASVSIRCPDTWFFANPPTSCPGSPPHSTALQAEYFEQGLMLWTGWNDFIYTLYVDGAAPQWNAQPNAWFAGMPLDDPALAPPPDYFQPVRGFGVVWRDEQTLAGSRVRDRVGWATTAEFTIPNAAFQCDSAPKYITCFITGPDGEIYRLKPERSGWDVWPR